MTPNDSDVDEVNSGDGPKAPTLEERGPAPRAEAGKFKRLKRLMGKESTRILAYLTVLVAALGPGTAWINGCQDRRLQERRADDDISLHFMNLVVQGFGTPDDRRQTLSSLRTILMTETPREGMVAVLDQQLGQLDRAQSLERDLAESQKKITELESQRRASLERERLLKEELSSSDAAAIELRSQVENERTKTIHIEQQLEDEREENERLSEEIRRAQSAAGARPVSSNQETWEESYRRLGMPEVEIKLIRSLFDLCDAYGGAGGGIAYTAPDEPSIECAFPGGRRGFLDQGSLKMQNTRWIGALPFRFSGRPEDEEALYWLCGQAGGDWLSSTPPPGFGYPFAVLCQLDDSKKVIQIPVPGY